MNKLIAVLALAGALAPLPGNAQSIPGAVLAVREPHHHLTYEDSAIRVLRVRVPAHDTTLLHEHDPDYFWIALGASDVVNAKLGAPDATIASRDLSIHYTPGHFAHVARNPGAAPFDNITVELFGTQTNIRNLCETATAAQSLDCPATQLAHGTGVTEHPAFSTNRLRVSLVAIEPGAVLRSSAPNRDAWLIALDTADTRGALVTLGAGGWRGGVYRPARGPWAVRNDGKRVSRALLLLSAAPAM